MFDEQVLQDAIINGKYIGAGAARLTVAISDKVVAKVCHKSRTLQSQHEIAFYEKYEETHKDFLVKMYGYAYDFGSYGTVLFMEKVEPLDALIMNFLEAVYEPFGDKLKYEMLDMFDKILEFEEAVQLSDSSNNSGNWGVTEDGRVVVLDCGISYDHDLEEYNTWYNGADNFYSGNDNRCYANCYECAHSYCIDC